MMTGPGPVRSKVLSCIGTAVAALCLLTSCSRPEPNRVQGYVEGEFVYVASPYAGALGSLYVRRGAQVKVGDPLFALENTSERTGRDEARRRLAQAHANLEDAKKGKRPSEIESIEAQLKQARSALVLSEREYSRQEQLLRIPGATSQQDIDRARSTRDQDGQRVAQAEADLKTAQLGARTDQVAAAEAEVRAREATLARAEWDLSQKRQTAPKAGLVFDTLYREGEWVAAGRPVIALLPPQNIKVRAFVPEPRVGALHPGDSVQVFVDGVREPFIGKVSFISPQAEYTPPVIYSRESRGKLVFMIEAVFDPKIAVNLHPGQPVEVQFGS
jgi:HlyD family secretion protein